MKTITSTMIIEEGIDEKKLEEMYKRKAQTKLFFICSLWIMFFIVLITVCYYWSN